MTTLCLASQCAFIASRDIRNNIVLVNSLIDANTDGVIMMLDWAMAYNGFYTHETVLHTRETGGWADIDKC